MVLLVFPKADTDQAAELYTKILTNQTQKMVTKDREKTYFCSTEHVLVNKSTSFPNCLWSRQGFEKESVNK